MIQYRIQTLTLTLASLALLGTAACSDPLDLEASDPQTLMQRVELATPVEGQVVEDATIRDGGECTLEARPAAIVSVLRSAGAVPVPLGAEATVAYRRWSDELGWGPIEVAACSNEDCTLATLGYGEPGAYLIGAFACGDASLARVEVGMGPAGCHVATKHVPLVLEDPQPTCMAADDELAATEPSTTSRLELGFDDQLCPSDAGPAPALVATTGVLDGDLLWPMTPEQISLERVGVSRDDALRCLDARCTSFIGGWGETGTFEVRAQLCGEELSETVEVELDPDTCQPGTRWVNLHVDAGLCTAGVREFEERA